MVFPNRKRRSRNAQQMYQADSSIIDPTDGQIRKRADLSCVGTLNILLIRKVNETIKNVLNVTWFSSPFFFVCKTNKHFSDLHFFFFLVCCAVAHGYNFDAISCESCKAFFRRKALFSLVKIFALKGNWSQSSFLGSIEMSSRWKLWH